MQLTGWHGKKPSRPFVRWSCDGEWQFIITESFMFWGEIIVVSPTHEGYLVFKTVDSCFGDEAVYLSNLGNKKYIYPNDTL